MTPDRMRDAYSVIAGLENNNLDLSRSYNNYRNVVMLPSLYKRGKKKSNAHYEGVIMRFIEKRNKENG